MDGERTSPTDSEPTPDSKRPPDDALVGSQRAALNRARTVSRLLDDAVRVPGTNFRVGLDPVLGVVPGGGDAVAWAISLYVVLEAINVGAPRDVVLRMLALLAVDAVVGSVPVVGTLFDAVWKANRWNVGMLEAHVEGTPETRETAPSRG